MGSENKLAYFQKMLKKKDLQNFNEYMDTMGRAKRVDKTKINLEDDKTEKKRLT